MRETLRLTWLYSKRAFTFLLAGVSFANVIFRVKSPADPWQYVVVIIVLLCLVGIAISDWFELRSAQPKLRTPYENKRKINAYMLRLLEKSARVAIFSNDLTWVRESESVRNLLSAKAANDEVTIVIPKMVPVAASLQQSGARVVTYPGLGVVPKTRFTVLFHGTADARLAVGRRDGDYHVIREYHGNDLPYVLAEDMIKIISAYSGIAASDIGIPT